MASTRFINVLLYISLCFLLSIVAKKDPNSNNRLKKSKSNSKSKSKLNKKCTNSEHFNFDHRVSPTYQLSLSYCRQYRSDTCCNKTHTDRIIHSIYAVLEDEFSVDCREKTVNIGCSPCDPRIGTQYFQGICPDLCSDWYSACKNDYFHFNKRNQLTPCSQHSLIGSQLKTIISNGSQLCELAGYQINHQSINCYNGQLPRFKTIPKNAYSSYTAAASKKNMFEYFSRIFRQFKRSWRGIYSQLLKFPKWQQLLCLSATLWLIFSFVSVIRECLTKLFNNNNNNHVSNDDHHNQECAGNKNDSNIASAEELRAKRLSFLAKQTQTNDQQNLEKKMAQMLGLAQQSASQQSQSPSEEDSQSDDEQIAAAVHNDNEQT